MARNMRFKELLDEGVASVARRQVMTMSAVEREIAEELDVSQHTVQWWRKGNVPSEIDQVEYLVRHCVQFGRLDHVWAKGLLTQAGHLNPKQLLAELFPARGKSQEARVFVCYARDVEPDESVGLQVSQALSEPYHVFFDQAKQVDQQWVERVHTELGRADVFIVLLSAESVYNEVVLLEVETAYRLSEKQGGRPAILPVRLAYRGSLPEPVHTYLDGQDWTFWRNDEETPRLITELKRAVSQDGVLTVDEVAQAMFLQEEAPPPTFTGHLEIPGGAMDLQSAFYIERDFDRPALETITRRGATITIKGPRQMGKSSLLMRIAEAAQGAGKDVAFLDFQLFKSSMVDADTFFRQFCASLSRRLGLEDRTEEYWSLSLTNPFRSSEYIGHYLLDALDRPLVLAMDEVDSIFETEFQTDFFAMLRTWHNNRAFEPTWKRLDLALVTSTEPYTFIDNLNQSPFNVGEIIELQDFTSEQVAELNRRHGSPLHAEQERQLMILLNGHPYLVHQALYQVASQNTSADDLFAHAADDRGPFGNHLRSLLYRLHDREDLIAGLQQVVRDHACEDEDIYYRLRGAGLVRREGRTVVPRCRLYGEFFQRHFDG